MHSIMKKFLSLKEVIWRDNFEKGWGKLTFTPGFKPSFTSRRESSSQGEGVAVVSDPEGKGFEKKFK